MSEAGRIHLCRIWRDATEDSFRRCAAFDIWAAALDPRDLSLLRAVSEDPDLIERVLKQRLRRGDRSAVPDLIRRLDEEGRWWWHEALNVPCADLILSIDRKLAERAKNLLSSEREEHDDDWLLNGMLARMPATVVEDLLARHWEGLRICDQYVHAALYLATSRSKVLAADAIRKADKPEALFEHIVHGFGYQYADHPGIKREEQILALEPYLHLLEPTSAAAFARACNEAGCFGTRKRLFDPLLPDDEHSWRADTAFGQFDKMAAQRHHWIDRDINNALKTGISWGEYRDAIKSWLNQRRSFEALKLTASALRHAGTRDDLSLLVIQDSMPREQAQRLIEDTVYAVKLRTFE